MLSKRNHHIKSLYAEMSSCNISDIMSLIVTKATKHSIHLYLKCWIPLINNGISYKKCSIGTSAFSRYKRLKSVVQQNVLCFAKKRFSIKDFFSKCDQIWSHLLKKSSMENFIFCAVLLLYNHKGNYQNVS